MDRQYEARHGQAGGPDTQQCQPDEEVEADVVAEVKGFVGAFPGFEDEE